MTIDSVSLTAWTTTTSRAEYYNDKPDLASADPISVTAGSETPGINAVLTTAGSISGTVTDHLSDPLAGICVVAFDSTIDAFVGSGSTDVNGDYSVTGLETDDYRLVFYGCPGTDFVVGEYYNDKPDLDSADLIAVTVGSDTSGVDAQLAPGGSISGTVTDSSSNPIFNIRIDAYDSGGNLVNSGGGISGSTSTSFDGTYTVSGLPPGDYRLRFRNFFGNFAPEYYDDKPDLASADPVTVTAGSDAPGKDVVLSPGGSITGTLTDASSNPVAACVRVFDPEGNSVSGPPEQTDGNGDYAVNGLATGDHRLEFYDCANEDSFGFYDNKPDLASADPIPVTAGSTTSGIDMQVAGDTTPPDTTINSGPSGTITTDEATFTFAGDPAGDTAKIQCRIDGGAFADCTSPKTFSGLSDGSHTAEFRAEDAAGNQDATPATRTFSVDTTPPVITIASGPSGTSNSATASFAFGASESGVSFECQLDGSGFSSCDSPKVYGSLSNGAHTFQVRGTDPAGLVSAQSATRSWSFNPSATSNTTSGTVSAGGIVGTDPTNSGPTAQDPTTASISLPNGGEVEIVQEPASDQPPSGFSIVGQQFRITAPDATVSEPLILVFRLDSSAVPSGTPVSLLTLLRDGVAAADCTGPTGNAAPDPCVASRQQLPDGDVVITVLTSRASTWAAVAGTNPPDTTPPDTTDQLRPLGHHHNR